MNTALHIFDVCLRVAALLFAVLFVYHYSKVNWRATAGGRHLMQFTRMIIFMLTLTLSVVFFGPHAWILWAGRIGFAWAAYLLFRRYRMQREAQKKLSSTKPEINPPVLLRRKEES